MDITITCVLVPENSSLAATDQCQCVERQFHYDFLTSYFAFNFGYIQSYGRVHVISLVSVEGVN